MSRYPIRYDDRRAAWNARAPRSGGHPYVGPDVKRYAAGHWVGPNPTGITHSDPHSRCLAAVRAWQDYHMDTHGWRDLGYPVCVCVHGRVIEGCEGGPYVAAANVMNMNTPTVGILFMRGQGETTTPDMRAAGVRVYVDLTADLGRYLTRKGHRDLWRNSAGQPLTACPGDEIEAWWTAPRLEGKGANDMDELRQIIREEVAQIDLSDTQRDRIYGNHDDSPSRWSIRKAVAYIAGQAALVRLRQWDHRRENQEQTARLEAKLDAALAGIGSDPGAVAEQVDGALARLRIVRDDDTDPADQEGTA